MSQNVQHEIARFQCLSEDGTEYTVIEYQNLVRSRPADGPFQDVAGAKELRLANGTPVTFVDDQTFQIAKTGQLVRVAEWG